MEVVLVDVDVTVEVLVDVDVDVLEEVLVELLVEVDVDVDVEVLVDVLVLELVDVDVDVLVDVEVDVEVDVVVVSQPLHVLSHLAPNVEHRSSAKITSHCPRGNRLRLLAQRGGVELVDVEVDVVAVVDDEVEVDVDVLVDVDVVDVVVSQPAQVLSHCFATESDVHKFAANKRSHLASGKILTL